MKIKKENLGKLNLEKITIVKLENLAAVKGGRLSNEQTKTIFKTKTVTKK